MRRRLPAPTLPHLSALAPLLRQIVAVPGVTRHHNLVPTRRWGRRCLCQGDGGYHMSAGVDAPLAACGLTPPKRG